MKESDYLKVTPEIVAKFRKTPIFHHLDEERIKSIVGLCKVRSWAVGEEIIREGEFDNWMYILISGAVRVVKSGMEIDVLSHLGEVMGEMGVLDGQARSATVVAKEPTLCLAVDASIMDRMNEQDRIIFHAVLYRTLAENMSKRLRKMDEELVRLKEEVQNFREFGTFK